MENAEILVSLLALMLGASWASGINFYAVLFILGLGGVAQHIALPSGLDILQSPVIISFAAIMYCVEFFTDKIPNMDDGWDALHTFVRIPGGAFLAAGVMEDFPTNWQIFAGVAGAYTAMVTHATKVGSRVFVNSLPKPFSGWAVSVGEDLLVLGILWCAVNQPELCVILILVFVATSLWMLPRIWRALQGLFQRVGKLFASQPAAAK